MCNQDGPKMHHLQCGSQKTMLESCTQMYEDWVLRRGLSARR